MSATILSSLCIWVIKQFKLLSNNNKLCHMFLRNQGTQIRLISGYKTCFFILKTSLISTMPNNIHNPYSHNLTTLFRLTPTYVQNSTMKYWSIGGGKIKEKKWLVEVFICNFVSIGRVSSRHDSVRLIA
jgi:hypothetical protein